MNNESGYIYESPDGKTIYRRRFNETEKELVTGPESDLFSFQALKEISELSKNNASLKKALDNLLLIYYTIKDEHKD